MLEALNLFKTYSKTGQIALNDVSLSVNQGDFVSIQGRSGSGKSTLLGVLASLSRPDSGELSYKATDMLTCDETTRNTLRGTEFAIIFQQHHLLPWLNALENTLLPFMTGVKPVSRDLREKALGVLSRVGLKGKEKSLPGSLSGGEQQRVAIARALLKDARLLFADEPTGSLDSATGAAIMALLEELNAEGLTTLMVTHNPEYAARAGKEYQMRDGTITRVK